MNKWIVQSTKLLGQWDTVAANKALIYLSQDREKTTDELLMGYALAERIYNLVFQRYVSQRQTLSSEDEENLELAIELARKAIPVGHPLLSLPARESEREGR